MTRLAVHVHSTWSHDGTRSLSEIAQLFRRLRYDAVMLCEHDTDFDAGRWQAYRAACRAASQDGAVLIPGMEYSDPDNVVHIPVWGAEAFLGRSRPTRDLLADLHGGTFAVLAHPERRDAWARFDPTWLESLAGVEIWNRKYDGVRLSHRGVDLIANHPRLRPTVGLDFHTRRQLFPFALQTPSAVVDVPSAVEAARHPLARWTVIGLDVRRLEGPEWRRRLSELDRTRMTILRVMRSVR